jgi:RimJ/RimL family protein N-acetyltransferase
MRNPYLIGEQVYLRPVEEADAATCYPWMNDPDVRRNLNLRARPNTEAASRAFFRAIDFRNDQVFAIVTRAGGEYVGNCGLHEIDFIDRHATLGIVIGRKDHWDRGLGTETVRLVCRHAFETLNLHKVCLHCYASNERGLKVYERVGFKVEGRLREHQFIDGRYDDEIVMGLLRAELRLA